MSNVQISKYGDVVLTDGLSEEELDKMGCGGKMEKAEPGYKAEKITDVNPAFMAESGGQTKSGYFTTNGKTIETEDAKKTKKGKKVLTWRLFLLHKTHMRAAA